MVARRTHLALVGLLLAGALTVLLLVAPPPDADAASCSSSRGFVVENSVSSTTGYTQVRCNDGRLHIVGSLTDRACDNRTAYVTFSFYSWRGVKYASASTSVGGGCGSRASYDHSAPPWDSGGNPFAYARVCVYAANFWGASSVDCANVVS